MSKQDHDALIIFILACIICGLQTIKSCKEEEKENGQQPTTRTTVLPTLKEKKTEIIRFFSADGTSDNTQYSDADLRDAERMQK
ncbi:hypothetical protein CL634_05220 [bacterium]|nr:hypothetical protein [bacterium]